MDNIPMDSFTLELGLEIALAIVGLLICVIGLVSLVVSGWLAIKYFRFNRKENSAGLTGDETARKVLDSNGLQIALAIAKSKSKD